MQGRITVWRIVSLLGVLGLLVAGYTSFDVIAGTTPAAGYARVSEQLSTAIATCRELEAQVLPYDVVFRRNPMTPLVDAQGQLISSAGMHGGLSVQGIIWSPEHPMVIVDDELFSPGDAVGPYTIVEVRPDGAIVLQGVNTLFIPLDRGMDTGVFELLNPPPVSVAPHQ